MIRELWGSFPKLLEQNINGLLDGAHPNPTKAFQLYRSLKSEDLWHDNFDAFSRNLDAYYSKPRAQRKKSDFDKFLNRPMDHHLYGAFHLGFRTAQISEDAIINVASWAHNLMRVSLKKATSIISLDMMTKTLKAVTNPAPYEKDIDIEFEDFCSAWKKTVFKAFGKQHDPEMAEVLRELRTIKEQFESEELKRREPSPNPMIYLTQTEIDWAHAVRDSALQGAKAPKFPLSKGPSKQALMDLERVVQLYEIVRITSLPELIKHRESTRATILDRCDSLLGLKKLAA